MTESLIGALTAIERELAAELPHHLRAFARAHAAGAAPPPAPLVARSAATVDIAWSASSQPDAAIAARGLALLQLVAPIAIESDPIVVAAHAQPRTWPNLAALTRARDAVCQARFGCRAIELIHRLHGTAALPPPSEVSLVNDAPPAAWSEPDGAPLDDAALAAVWRAIAVRLAIPNAAGLRIVRAATSAISPRAFAIAPGAEVVAVVPPIVASPAARFAVLHELGHAAAALASPAPLSRAVDEAAADHVARLAELPDALPPPWPSPLAAAARARRAAIAAALDAVERALPDISEPPCAVPPHALWDDPGAQAAYRDPRSG